MEETGRGREKERERVGDRETLRRERPWRRVDRERGDKKTGRRRDLEMRRIGEGVSERI